LLLLRCVSVDLEDGNSAIDLRVQDFPFICDWYAFICVSDQLVWIGEVFAMRDMLRRPKRRNCASFDGSAIAIEGVGRHDRRRLTTRNEYQGERDRERET
jgi:hypothetical protein